MANHRNIIREMVVGRWHGPGGYAHVLQLAVPLVVSTGAHTVQMFLDSVMLSRYDRDAMAATLLAGVVNWTVLSFFMGLVGYVNTFVAQIHRSQSRQTGGTRRCGKGYGLRSEPVY